MVASQVWSMNWNSPVAEDVFALASGLRLDSRMAVLSKYSKPAPVALAASRIALVTRDATSVVAPLIQAAMSMAASMRAPWVGPDDPLPRLAGSAVMVKDRLTWNLNPNGRIPFRRDGGIDGGCDSAA